MGQSDGVNSIITRERERERERERKRERKKEREKEIRRERDNRNCLGQFREIPLNQITGRAKTSKN